jgi:hypothetical protein
MRRRGISISPRAVVFLGCEGESEQAYAQLLNDEIRHRDLPFHIQAELLSPGAGDPISRVRRAVKMIKHAGNDFCHRAILMDLDQIENDSARISEVCSLAQSNTISIIWQKPCHEAFLLNHFAGHEHRAPATSPISLNYLLKIWPEYRKPMTRFELSKRISGDEIVRVSAVHPEFAEILEVIRLIP